MGGETTDRVVKAMIVRDLLDQAVTYLAIGAQPLMERLERCSVPLAAISREDLETEEELALHGRVQLGLTQVRRARAASLAADPDFEDVPVFALEATASHVVDLRDATTRRALRAVRGRARDRRR